MSETFETALGEHCGTETPYEQGILEIPDGIQEQISQIHSETSELQKEHLRNVLDNYIGATLSIASGNDILDQLLRNEVFQLMVTGMQESGFSLPDIDIIEGKDEIFQAALERLSKDFPSQYREYVAGGHFDISLGGQSFSLENLLPPLEALPDAPQEPEREQWRNDTERSLGIEIHGREDVNSVEIVRRIDYLLASHPREEFSLTDAETLLTEAFTFAFSQEMAGIMRTQTQDMRENYASWSTAFGERFDAIGDPELRDMLLFLPFVESNLDPKAQSPAGALGLWQITLPTAQRNAGGFDIVQEDLFDPLTSTKIAARYLDRVISGLKEDFPQASEQQIVFMALREYNGAWSTRLKPEFRVEPLEAILRIYVQLDLIKAVYEDPRISDEEKVQQMMQYVAGIETTYFDGHALSDYIREQGYDTPASIQAWSENYLKKIILQQLMYPYQVAGAYHAYQNIDTSL